MINSTAKKWAINFIYTFSDQYEDEPTLESYKVKKWPEEKALRFVVNHIDDMIAINGTDDLFFVELEAIKELNLYKRYELTKKFVISQLKTYEG